MYLQFRLLHILHSGAMRWSCEEALVRHQRGIKIRMKIPNSLLTATDPCLLHRAYKDAFCIHKEPQTMNVNTHIRVLEVLQME